MRIADRRLSFIALAAICVLAVLGLSLLAACGGRVYFYGGPAESTVSAYDPATGELSDVPELRAPAGTYIRALFVR